MNYSFKLNSIILDGSRISSLALMRCALNIITIKAVFAEIHCSTYNYKLHICNEKSTDGRFKPQGQEITLSFL